MRVLYGTCWPLGGAVGKEKVCNVRLEFPSVLLNFLFQFFWFTNIFLNCRAGLERRTTTFERKSEMGRSSWKKGVLVTQLVPLGDGIWNKSFIAGKFSCKFLDIYF